MVGGGTTTKAAPFPSTLEVREMMAIKEPPIREAPTRPAATTHVTTARRARFWLWIAGVAAALIAVGVGVLIGLTLNSGEIESTQADVASLQTDMLRAQEEVSGLRLDMVMLKSGYSLEREHLAQAN